MSWPGDGKEFDMKRLPGNPRMTETVEDFLTRQRKFITSLKFPPGTKFECIGCGDCCKWNYIMLNTDEALIGKLKGLVKYPHGSWGMIKEGRVQVQMGYMKAIDVEEGDEGPDLVPASFSFIGNIPPNQSEFIMVTGRRWGYWTVNDRGKVVLYNPTPCIHHDDETQCGIYLERPRVCRTYFCGRHPILP